MNDFTDERFKQLAGLLSEQVELQEGGEGSAAADLVDTFRQELVAFEKSKIRKLRKELNDLLIGKSVVVRGKRGMVERISTKKSGDHWNVMVYVSFPSGDFIAVNPSEL